MEFEAEPQHGEARLDPGTDDVVARRFGKDQGREALDSVVVEDV